MILGEKPVESGEFGEGLAGFFAAVAPKAAIAVSGGARGERPQSGAFPVSQGALGERGQSIGALFRRGRRANDMQPIGDQRIFDIENRRR